MASLSHYAQNYLVSGVAAPRRGNGGFGGIPSQTFACADGAEIFLVASTPEAVGGRWPRSSAAPSSPTTNGSRRCRPGSPTGTSCCAPCDEAFRTRPASDWIPELEAADVPVSPVNDLDGVFANPQVRHRGLRATVDHPVSGRVDVLRNPIRMSGTPDRGLPHAPDAGQHTIEILVEDCLGKRQDEITRLQ